MKQYKLIKEYPGSPSLGHILTQNEEGVYGPFDGPSLSHIDVEDNPEYYREVVIVATYGQHIVRGDELWWMRVKPVCEGCICDVQDESLYQYGPVEWVKEGNDFSNDTDYMFFTSVEECERFLNTSQFSIRDIQFVYELVNANYNLQEFFNRLFYGDK